MQKLFEDSFKSQLLIFGQYVQSKLASACPKDEIASMAREKCVKGNEAGKIAGLMSFFKI